MHNIGDEGSRRYGIRARQQEVVGDLAFKAESGGIPVDLRGRQFAARESRLRSWSRSCRERKAVGFFKPSDLSLRQSSGVEDGSGEHMEAEDRGGREVEV